MAKFLLSSPKEVEHVAVSQDTQLLCFTVSSISIHVLIVRLGGNSGNIQSFVVPLRNQDYFLRLKFASRRFFRPKLLLCKFLTKYSISALSSAFSKIYCLYFWVKVNKHEISTLILRVHRMLHHCFLRGIAHRQVCICKPGIKSCISLKWKLPTQQSF